MRSDNLNPEQQRAAEHVEGPALVLAGAGAGKTRVVTRRIINLIEKGVDPSSILAVTFTNKAAQEMRERVEKMTARSVMIRTFHSLGAFILRCSIEPLGYDSEFTIYDEGDSIKIVKTCMEEFGIKSDKVKPKAVKNAISRVKSTKNGIKSLDMNLVPTGAEDVFVKLYNSYQNKLKKSNAVDFDDLLFLTAKLFREHPEVLERYQNKWSFLLIDEYQDTNSLQRMISSQLIEKTQNIFVVGDPDQSIYSWRGANVENILQFEKDYPDATVVNLEQNYRSTNNILKAANALICNNDNRYEKDLWSDLSDGDKLSLYEAKNEYDEVDFVMERTVEHRNSGLNLREMVVFYRTNSQSRVFEDSLIQEGIPYVIFGGISFYQRREVKDILAFLRMVYSDSDIVSFMRTINLPKRGFGAVTLKNIQREATEKDLPIFKFCKKLINGEESLRLTAKQKQGLKEYVSIIDQLQEIGDKNDLKELVYQTIDLSGYLNFLELDKETYQDRKSNLDELVKKASEMDQENRSLGLFLEELSLKSATDESSQEFDYLNLMTVHHGKGLEFELVFLTGMEEDLFPHMNSKGDLAQIEEERRLCYVGMTRAKRFLYFTRAKKRNLWGSPRALLPSRFLKEIPHEYTQKIYKSSLFKYDFKTYSNDQDVSAEVIFDEGISVFHKEFGEGQISRVYEDDSFGTMYEIYFPSQQSIKKLAAKHAELTAE